MGLCWSDAQSLLEEPSEPIQAYVKYSEEIFKKIRHSRLTLKELIFSELADDAGLNEFLDGSCSVNKLFAQEFPELIKLDVSGNYIEYLPENIGKNCPKLEELNLNSNSDLILSDNFTFENYPNLAKLYVLNSLYTYGGYYLFCVYEIFVNCLSFQD